MSTSTASKEALFAPRLTEEDVDVPGVGTVRVRALSRERVLAFRKRELKGGAEEMERVMVAAALVAPELTEDEVGQWQAASTAGELEVVTRVISRLSGLDVEAAKEAVKRFRG